MSRSPAASNLDAQPAHAAYWVSRIFLPSFMSDHLLLFFYAAIRAAGPVSERVLATALTALAPLRSASHLRGVILARSRKGTARASRGHPLHQRRGCVSVRARLSRTSADVNRKTGQSSARDRSAGTVTGPAERSRHLMQYNDALTPRKAALSRTFAHEVVIHAVVLARRLDRVAVAIAPCGQVELDRRII